MPTPNIAAATVNTVPIIPPPAPLCRAAAPFVVLFDGPLVLVDTIAALDAVIVPLPTSPVVFVASPDAETGSAVTDVGGTVSVLALVLFDAVSVAATVVLDSALEVPLAEWDAVSDADAEWLSDVAWELAEECVVSA